MVVGVVTCNGPPRHIMLRVTELMNSVCIPRMDRRDGRCLRRSAMVVWSAVEARHAHVHPDSNSDAV